MKIDLGSIKSRLKLIRKVFLKISDILNIVHNDAKLCLLNIRPEKILISQVGEDLDPYLYDLTMASNLSGDDPDSKLAHAFSIFDSFKNQQSDESSAQYFPTEV